MLNMRAWLALECVSLDKKYEDVFCGLGLREYTIHIWKREIFKDIAELLGKEIFEEERDDSEYPTDIFFYEEMFGIKWKVFALCEVSK